MDWTNAIIGLVGILLAGNGIVSGVIMHTLKKHDEADKTAEQTSKIIRVLDRISEGLQLSLECHLVTFEALKAGKLNGEAEQKAREVKEYLAQSTGKGFRI